jgi:flagellar hook assembly protein FlgD
MAGLPVILSAILMVGVLAGLFVLFPLDWMRTPSVTVSSEQEAFSPNQDGDQDTAVILYALSEKANVSVYVLDDARGRVRSLLAEDLQEGGQHSVVWDGRGDRGKIVPDGQYYVRVAAKGTARETNATVPILVDTVPPLIRLANMPENMRVKEPDIVVEGVTEPDATVWFNNGALPIPIDGSGGFRVEHRLQEGDNSLEVAVTDNAGNKSSIRREVTLILKPPDIVIDNPPNDLWINQKLLSVQGRVPPDTTIAINGKEATVDEDGRYNVDLLLQEGENLLKFEANDPVGNVATAERRVFLKTRPPALTLTSVKEGMEVTEPSLLVVGQTEVGASVRLNGRELTVDSRGGFQGLVNLVQGENLIRAEATDRAGNVMTLSRRLTYAAPETSLLPSNLNVILPAAILGVGTILVSWLLFGGWLSPIAISFSADRSVMSPDPQGNIEPVLLSLGLSRSAKVTVDVWNERDELVTTLLYRRQRGSGEHLLVWNGLDDEGMIVPFGAYEIEATASTLTTSVSSSVRLEFQAASPRLVERRQSSDRTSMTSRSR